MNYRELLKRYMQHVISEEGTSFVEFSSIPWGPKILSKEDRAELERIEAEIRAEQKKGAE